MDYTRLRQRQWAGAAVQSAAALSGYPFVNAEASTVSAAMTTPPSNARNALIDTFVGALKTAGVWTLLDVMYVLAAADSQAAKINWKNPGTFDAIEVSSPAFVADRGFTGNGTSSYLRSQYVPSTNATNLTQDNASIWAFSLTDAGTSTRDIGTQSGPAISMMIRTVGDTTAANVNDGSNASVGTSITNSIGLFGATRQAAGTKLGWKNGANTGSFATASTGLPATELWICGANPSSFSTKQIAFAAWGASLASKESAFYTAVLAYLQGVGAQ